MPPDIIVYGLYKIGIIYRPMHNLKYPIPIESGILDQNISEKIFA